MRLFGFDIRKTNLKKDEAYKSVVSPENDGSIAISNNSAFYSSSLNISNSIQDENELIARYRDIASYPICDGAIEDIVSEAVSSDSDETAAMLDLDALDMSENVKTKIIESFDEIKHLLKLDNKIQDIFKRWYIDARLSYQMILYKDTKKGIAEIRYIDPMKIRKIREVNEVVGENGARFVDNIEEYFIFNDDGISGSHSTGIRLSPDSIAHITSGNTDANTGISVGYLHKALKPVNQLKMLEDAMVIYRLVRAPERRIFYVDVGTLNEPRAKQYMTQIMNKYRNKIVYDSTTGELSDSKQHLSFQEDFFIPRRNEKNTEITTLQGGSTNTNIDDVEYFKKMLYQSLNVPISRLESNAVFSLGKSSEITRDELKFTKFIDRLRTKFAELFYQLLRVQLIAKGIIGSDDWDDIEQFISIRFTTDNFFSEFKTNEVLAQRISMVQELEPYIGKFYSNEYVFREILKMTNEQVEEMKAQIKAENTETPVENTENTEQPSNDDTDISSIINGVKTDESE